VNESRAIPVFGPFLYALLVAIPVLLLIDARTNTTPPRWDAVYYVDIAESGLTGTPNRVAPFAYRPGMPLVSRGISTLLGVSIEDGFRIVGWTCALLFMMGIFALSRNFTTDYRHALLPMIVLVFSFYHVKFPMFFPTLVDVSAYALIVVAFWALITKRFLLCLVVSGIGLLFKEFLLIPLVLLVLQAGGEFLRTRSGLSLVKLSVALVAGAGAVLVPRLVIPVTRTMQFVDPLNDPSTLGRLISAPLDGSRLLNIAFASVSYWLPTILLLTRHRLGALWTELRRRDLLVVCGAYLILVFLLTLYGGTNIAVFVSYAAPVQAVVLALLYRQGVGIAETIYVILATLTYNRILLNIPDPAISFDAYIDFYGGWSSRVNSATALRLLECVAFVAIGALIRIVVHKGFPGGPRGVPRAA
jgi:hypothetical protein